MTLLEAQELIHALYEGDNDNPTSTSDEDWVLRASSIKLAVRRWENDEDGELWRELYVNIADASTGDQTVTSGIVTAGQADAPDDFVFLNGYVRVGTVFFEQILPEQAQSVTLSPNRRVVWVTGNRKVGYTLNFYGLDTTMVGTAFAYEYYKTASVPSATSDVFEMSNPLYAVHSTVADLFSGDGDTTRSSKHFSIAEEIYSGMKLKNMQLGALQSNQIPGNGAGFGF